MVIEKKLQKLLVPKYVDDIICNVYADGSLGFLLRKNNLFYFDGYSDKNWGEEELIELIKDVSKGKRGMFEYKPLPIEDLRLSYHMHKPEFLSEINTLYERYLQKEFHKELIKELEINDNSNRSKR